MRARTQAAVPLAYDISSVLAEVPGYKAKNQIVSPEEQRVAGWSNYVARVYLRGETVAFSTLVSYYERQAQGKTIHSPRNCLPGAGWEIVSGDTREVLVNGQPRTVNRYLLQNGRTTAVAYYWYQGRGRVTASEYAVKWNLLRDAALSGRTEEALVRIIVPVTENEPVNRADAVLTAIAPTLMSEVDRVLPRSNSHTSS